MATHTDKYKAYRSRTHLWQRDPPYVLDTVFRRFDILLRSSGREGVIWKWNIDIVAHVLLTLLFQLTQN